MVTIRVSEIMTTSPRTVREEDSVFLTDWLLRLDGIHHVVVLDRDERVSGIVSDRDMLRAFGKKPDGELPIREIMQRNVITVGPDTTASDALDRMLTGRFHALPVVDADRHLMGIVTATDFLEVTQWVLHRFDPRAPHASARDGAAV